MFKINNKNTRTILLTLLWFIIVNFGYILHVFPEALVQRRSVKKVFLEILQNSQESTCIRVSFRLQL